MYPRWSQGTDVRRLRAPLRLAALVAAITLAAAACSHPAARTAATIKSCGRTRTSANVPIKIEVARGQVSCTAAMTVEHNYATAVARGRAPGNGGGGPVTIHGWKCHGFPTPQVLKTGQASECVRGTTQILAILPPA
jgi:hypothetical protein